MVPSFLTKEIRDTISQCMNPNPMSRPTADKLLCESILVRFIGTRSNQKLLKHVEPKTYLNFKMQNEKVF